MDQDRMLKFSSYVHLQTMNKIFQYHYARLILCSEGKDIIFEHEYYISAFKRCYDGNIKQLCSPSMYKPNLEIFSRLGDLVRCIYFWV